jgi:hypothetical protein
MVIFKKGTKVSMDTKVNIDIKEWAPSARSRYRFEGHKSIYDRLHLINIEGAPYRFEEHKSIYDRLYLNIIEGGLM